MTPQYFPPSLYLVPFCQLRTPQNPLHYPIHTHSTQHCSLHSFPHKRQSMSSSNKISEHKLHSNMLYRPSTAHALYSFYVCTRQTTSAMLSSNYIPQQNSVSIHMNMHYTPRTTHPPAFHNPPMHTTNTKHSWQNGTRCRDGGKYCGVIPI